MRMTINTVHCDLPESGRATLHRRAAFALSRFSPRIAGISLRITDVNGPRGGVGFSSLARVRLHRSATEIIATADSDDPLQSAALALERVRSGVAHAIDRLLARQERA